MPRIDVILLVVGMLFLVSVFASKLSARIGVPSLLLFAVIGMLAGSDGPGGIYFDFPWAAQLVGVIALSVILFSAGFDTRIAHIRPVLAPGISLATIGIVVTAATTGLFSSWILDFGWKEGLLLGAIVASTDAAAVFNVLRLQRLNLRGGLRELIEFESGSNDPMAVLLTILLIELIQNPEYGLWRAAGFLVLQILVGAGVGLAVGRFAVAVINGIKLEWEGLYPVLSIMMAVLAYGLAAVLEGSGFLAAYIAGLVLGQATLIHKNTLRLFHDGVAWLMQIAMFLVLGLQVFPSRLTTLAAVSMAIALFVMFVARPLSVFIALPGKRFEVREKLLVSWAGLKGAAPIVLATFPQLAGLPQSETIFHVVFFVALSSLLLQGTTIAPAAKFLRCEMAGTSYRDFPLIFNPSTKSEGDVFQALVGDGSPLEGKRIVDLALPTGVLILLLRRGDHFVVPQGGTQLQRGDTALIMASSEVRADVSTMFGAEVY